MISHRIPAAAAFALVGVSAIDAAVTAAAAAAAVVADGLHLP